MTHFGAAVREILSASCGSDLQQASATTALPALGSAAALRILATNLELAFGIEVPEEDLAHLRTVRDVLRCVRLRLWERRAAAGATSDGPDQVGPDRGAYAAFISGDARERFIRYTPSAPVTTPLLGNAAAKTA